MWDPIHTNFSMILPRKCTHALSRIYFVVCHDKVALFLRRSYYSIKWNQKREILESSSLFPCVVMYMGFKAVTSSLKYAKAPRKVYLLEVKASIKTDKIWVDCFHFAKENYLDFKTEHHVFIVSCWHDELMLNKMHIYHVSMYMFYVSLCVQIGKGFFCYICLWLER